MSSHTFFIDAATGIEHSYADFLKAIAGGSIANAKTNSPTYNAIVRLFRAIVRNEAIELESLYCDPAQAESRAEGCPAQAPNLVPELSCEKQLYELVLASTSQISLGTSGTTSAQPRNVIYSAKQLFRNIVVSENQTGKIWGMAYPVNRFAGLQVALQAIANGNTLVNLFGLKAPECDSALQELKVTCIGGTPTFFRTLIAEERPQTSVRQVTVGGEGLDSETFSRIQTHFPNARIYNIYASTEAGSLLVSRGDVFRVPTLLTGKIKVNDSRLHVHRSLLAKFENECDAEGFFDTGDVVELLSEHPMTFRFEQREGDCINVGGALVNPHKVETVLLSLDDVVDAAVYGKQNSVTGNLVCCDIVIHQRSEHAAETVLDTIKSRLAERLAAHETPRIINLVDSLSSNPTGKKLRR